jgi:hypothetical protein
LLKPYTIYCRLESSIWIQVELQNLGSSEECNIVAWTRSTSRWELTRPNGHTHKATVQLLEQHSLAIFAQFEYLSGIFGSICTLGGGRNGVNAIRLSWKISKPLFRDSHQSEKA